ncbi:TPA: S49 family peptidase [Escherichia coli]|uniref:S49 family peptidase n=1 Tax=Escherichia coli TaxID=562 RepID=UPI0002CAB475|nr:S49 family peptidase [Escherichia coli]EEW0418974.1 S49 family peptidase [Escherichia coli]EEX9683810.1 S49 family peptidase [Escherichia coli]EEZ4661306.1 S49 family peptidase [Escherichia coli]EFO2259753.1 S49 family peptidase [Escherichia coli]EGJ7892910.1 S49 family peptidase [Escherichia coli]
MRRNLSHIAAMAFNEPLLLEPAYARVFFCALGKEIGADSLAVPQQAVQLDADGMQLAVTDYMAGGQRPAKSYQVKNGIAILPVSGTLVHKLGTLRPYSGMTGYDGLTARLQMAVNDPDVRGILLDIDSPGGQAAGAFDCADMIYRLREQKPVWALCNDMACSAAMLLAAACTRRLVTQTAKIGSIGVMMAHTSYEKQLAQEGVDITLIYSGRHKVDGNSIQALPAGVRADFQRRIDEARRMFVDKVALYTGLSSEAVMNTEAAVYDGQAGIDAGLADQLINAADAVEVMVSALNDSVTKENAMTVKNLTVAEAVAQENQRVMGILNCQEAKGREQLAQMLAGQPGMTVEQAKTLLAAAPVAGTDSTGDQIMALPEAKGREQLAQMLAGQPGMTVEQAKAFLAAAPAASAAGAGDQIMALPEAKGREQLAQALAEQPGMTVDQAKTLLAAAPVAGSASVGDQIMALPEAKGRKQLAQALAEQPGMTVAQAKTLLAAAPAASQPSQEALFDRFMAQHAASAVSGGGTAGHGEEDLLMSMP